MEFNVKNPVGLAQTILTRGLQVLVSAMSSVTSFGKSFGRDEPFPAPRSGLNRPSSRGSSGPSVERRGSSTSGMRDSFQQANAYGRARPRSWASEPQATALRRSSAGFDRTAGHAPAPDLRRRASDPGPDYSKYVSDIRKRGSYNNKVGDLAASILADALGVSMNTMDFAEGGMREEKYGPTPDGSVPEINLIRTKVTDGAGHETPHWDPMSGDVRPDGDCLFRATLRELDLPDDNTHVGTFRDIAAEHLEKDLKSSHSKYKPFLAD